MGSKSKKIDPTVGNLVWVRRRNGSWWPGRIMGLHELPADCVISSKNQTPVKFLGRDNANMDWYNLDTSRRVKAFHCSEFRECVEKAKAAKGGQVMAGGSKRAAKYARREDAILHALELERESETQKQQHDVDTRADGGGMRKEQEDVDAEGNKQELSQSGISFEDPNDSTLKLHSLLKKRRKTPNDSEDDGNERTKRMRGIEDLVNGVEAKVKANVNCKTEESVLVNTPSISEPMEEDKLTHVLGTYSNLKKKQQNQVTSICETLKRKYRRRQLRKVLENSTMVSVPIFCDDGSGSVPSYYQEIKDRKDSMLDSTMDSSEWIYSSKDFATGSCQKQTSPDVSESKNSELSSISEIPEDDFSDSSLFDVPFVDDETHSGGLPHGLYAPKKFLSGQSGQVKSISLSSEGLDRYGSTSFTTEHDNISRKTKKGTSKWQLKRKRNSRSLGKKTSEIIYLGNSGNRDVEGDDFLPCTSHMDELCVGINPEVHAHNTLDESFLSEDDDVWSEHGDDDVADPSYENSNIVKKQRSKKKKVMMSAHGRGGKFMSLSRDKSVVAKPQTDGRSLPVLSLMDPRPPSHHQSFFLGNSRNDVSDVSGINFQWGSSLFDVNLEVRASYSGQNVPLVSLMSKFSGKAIVGHPLTVEVCSNGYCDILLNSANYSSMSRQSLDVEDEAVAGTLKAETGLYISKKTPVKHSTLKSSSKNKKNGITSKKTRSLSSFSGLPKQEAGRQTLVEKLKGNNVMACIPLTIVFSRIHESLS